MLTSKQTQTPETTNRQQPRAFLPWAFLPWAFLPWAFLKSFVRTASKGFGAPIRLASPKPPDALAVRYPKPFGWTE